MWFSSSDIMKNALLIYTCTSFLRGFCKKIMAIMAFIDAFLVKFLYLGVLNI